METFKWALVAGIACIVLYPLLASFMAWIISPYVIREAERIVEG